MGVTVAAMSPFRADGSISNPLLMGCRTVPSEYEGPAVRPQLGGPGLDEGQAEEEPLGFAVDVADFDLLVLGDCNPDVMVTGEQLEPVFGQAELLVDEARLVVGGSGSITACGAARLGLRTAFISVVGDDVFGRFMLDALGLRGVDVSGCVVDGERP